VIDMDALARTAYEAYGRHVGWKNYQGLPMPIWSELPLDIQGAWTAALVAVWNEAFPGDPEGSP
jgi:hypothetical protein